MGDLVGCKQEGSQWRKEDRSGLINIQCASVGALGCVYADSQVSVMYSHVMLGRIWFFVSLVLFFFYFAEKALWRLFRSALIHPSLDICSVCGFEMHVFTVMICGFRFFSNPSPAHFTSDFPLYLPVSFLLSSPHPAFIIFLPPVSSFPACQRGI